MFAIAIYIYTLFAACLCLSTQRNHELVLEDFQQDSIIRVRDAKLSDVDDVTRVILDAFSSDPDFDYQYQFREQHPDDHFECSRKVIKRAFQNKPENVVVKVIDAPVSDRNDHNHHTAAVKKSDASTNSDPLRVVAVAVWELFVDADADVPRRSHRALNRLSSRPSFFPWSTPNCAAHLDANMTRVNNSFIQFEAAKHKYIDTVYDSYLYLGLLATHPTWQNQGMGPANLAWGMREASKLQLPITLIATPAGYPVYSDTGFDSLANITISRLDGDEGAGFWYEVMKWTPPESESVAEEL